MKIIYKIFDTNFNLLIGTTFIFVLISPQVNYFPSPWVLEDRIVFQFYCHVTIYIILYELGTLRLIISALFYYIRYRYVSTHVIFQNP